MAKGNSMDILQNLLASSDLSQASKETYSKIAYTIIRTSHELKSTVSRSDALASEKSWNNNINTALYDIIQHPNKYQPIFVKHVTNLKTINSYYTTIKALIKHSKDPSLSPYKAMWDVFAKASDDEIRHQTDTHVVSDKQRSAMMKWTDILRTLSRLKKGSMEHLLLCTYVTYTRRQRDYSSVRIFTNPSDEIGNTACYIHLSPKDEKPYIYLSEGKTIKHYGAFKDELPKEFMESLFMSLKNDPRDYLFGKRSTDTFTKWCNNMLKRILNNDKVSVNTLRHSHAEYIDNKPGIQVAERKTEARKMGHSVMKQLEYNLQLDKAKKIPQATEICYKKDPITNEFIEARCSFIDEDFKEKVKKKLAASLRK